MRCTTIREGAECPFMSASGCTYNGGKCHELVEACKGCNRGMEVTSGWYCSTCPDPSVKWKTGNCNLATHVTATATVENKQKLNPLKASKRGK